MTKPKRDRVDRTPINQQDPQDAHGVNFGGLHEATCWDAGSNVKSRAGAPVPKLYGMREPGHTHCYRIADTLTAGPWRLTAWDAIADWNSDTDLREL